MPIFMTSQKIWFLNSIPYKDHWEIRFVIFRIKGSLQLVYWGFVWIISRHIHRLSIKTNSARYQQIEFRDFILYLLSFFQIWCSRPSNEHSSGVFWPDTIWWTHPSCYECYHFPCSSHHFKINTCRLW